MYFVTVDPSILPRPSCETERPSRARADMKTFLVVSSALTVLAFVGTAALLERAFRRAKRHPE